MFRARKSKFAFVFPNMRDLHINDRKRMDNEGGRK